MERDLFVIITKRDHSRCISHYSPISTMAHSNGENIFFLLFSEFVQDTMYDCVTMILTAVKIRTLRNVAIWSKNQLHILDNALATQREGCREKTERQ